MASPDSRKVRRHVVHTDLISCILSLRTQDVSPKFSGFSEGAYIIGPTRRAGRAGMMRPCVRNRA